MQRITDTMPVLISLIDKEMRYRFNNRAHERCFEFEQDRLQGKPGSTTSMPSMTD